MNIRNAVTKGLLATAIAGALAVVPMALSTGTAQRRHRELGRHRPVRVGRQLVHQHRQRRVRRPAVQAGDLVRQRRRRQSRDRLARRADPRRRERPAHRRGSSAWPKCGAQAGSPAVWANPTHADSADHDDRLRRDALHRPFRFHQPAPDVLGPASTRWARWGRDAEIVALRVDEHSGIRPHCPLPSIRDHPFVVHPDELPDQVLPAR